MSGDQACRFAQSVKLMIKMLAAAYRRCLAFSESEVRAFLKPRLAGFKIPKEFKIIDSLPRNAAGKVTKGELRERFI